MADAARAGRLPELAKYEVLEEIGHGGMATVYRALDRRLGREVAVKVIHPHLRDSREVVQRFSTEAKAVAKLRHPNIVEVYDVSGADDPELYLVVELVRGTTLRALLARPTPMPPEIAAGVALMLLDALAHAHASGVVHRDIKPENVLVELRPREATADDASGSGGARVAVKLTDFGIAKLLDAQGVTSTGQVLGSPAHMAPEQIEGGEVDGRSDVFGLGVLLYECLVGHLPFEGQNPAQVLRRVLEGVYPEAQVERPVVGARWSKIVDRAMARSQDARFPDAGAMKAAIVAELERLGVADSADPTPELAAWLDDPEAYVAQHTPRMIDRLRTLGDEARKRGDAISAAVDYNRALAQAPDDPQLLRIVARMSRAEARARALRRVARVGAVLVLGGAVAWFGARSLARYASTHGNQPTAAVVPAAEPLPLASAAASVVPAASAEGALSGAPARSRPAPLHLQLSLGRDGASKVTTRVLTLDLKPPMGVSVAVDGESPSEVTSGAKLTLDSKAHALEFTCPRRGGDDPCVPYKVTVPAGDKDDTLAVSVPVKPATLVVEGDLARTYQLVQHPEIPLRVGANTVPVRSAYEAVTVQELETGKTLSIRLEAGKTLRAGF
jgi:serine/threonine protein kinase